MTYEYSFCWFSRNDGYADNVFWFWTTELVFEPRIMNSETPTKWHEVGAVTDKYNYNFIDRGWHNITHSGHAKKGSTDLSDQYGARVNYQSDVKLV